MLKSFLAKIYAGIISRKVQAWANNPFESQDKVFKDLIDQAKNTKFGKDHKFGEIESYDDFKKHVPVRDYEGLNVSFQVFENKKHYSVWTTAILYGLPNLLGNKAVK